MSQKIIARYFTDCAKDASGANRLDTALTDQLFEAGFDPKVKVFPVKYDIEGGHCATEMLIGQRPKTPSLILINAATRNDIDRSREGWENGPPFGFAWVGKHLVVSTLTGHGFSLLKKALGGDFKVYITHIPEVVPWLFPCDEKMQRVVIATQFRSLLYAIPLAVKLMAEGPGSTPPIYHLWTETPDVGSRVSYIDEFGNIKLTITLQDLLAAGCDPSREFVVSTPYFSFRCQYYQDGLTSMANLAELPNLASGSSVAGPDFESDQLLELQIKMGSAAQALGIKPGDPIQIFQLG